MNRLFSGFITLCLILCCAMNARAWEVKIVNNSGHMLKYEVYQQTLFNGEQPKCSGYYAYDSIGGGTCPMDYFFCPTRVNIYVQKCCGNAPNYYQKLESGYLGAQCWNHRIEIKPATADKNDQNPPITWVWSYY